jgi:hypothetical protein
MLALDRLLAKPAALVSLTGLTHAARDRCRAPGADRPTTLSHGAHTQTPSPNATRGALLKCWASRERQRPEGDSGRSRSRLAGPQLSRNAP